MHPTIVEGRWVRVSRLAYRGARPERGDIVLFSHPQRARFMEVKRVYGLPGESVEIRTGTLIVDGAGVDDPFRAYAPRRTDRYWQLRDDEYVVLGDNRNYSTDSRSFGPVSGQRIIGKVILRQERVPTR